MAGCSNSLLVLDPSCDAIKKKGGFDATFFIGSVADLDAVAISTTGEVTGFTFAATKGFKKVTAKIEAWSWCSASGWRSGEHANAKFQRCLYANQQPKISVEHGGRC